MFKDFLLIAVRNLRKNLGYSFISIIGLATGMSVALLIGLWIWDELTYNTYHKNYDRIILKTLFEFTLLVRLPIQMVRIQFLLCQ